MTPCNDFKIQFNEKLKEIVKLSHDILNEFQHDATSLIRTRIKFMKLKMNISDMEMLELKLEKEIEVQKGNGGYLLYLNLKDIMPLGAFRMQEVEIEDIVMSISKLVAHVAAQKAE